MVLVIMAGLIAVVFGATVVVPLLAGSTKKELRAAKQRERIATKALRLIASGTAGNPTYEAQAALEEIEGNYIKELN